MKSAGILFAGLALLLAPVYGAEGKAFSPWGMCMHLNRPDEFAYQTERQFELCRQAGVKSLRMDFGFSWIAKEKGKYDFEHHEKVIAKAAEYGMDILPVLNGYAWEVEKRRPDAVPLHEHPEEWRHFVRAAAERFKGRIKVWSYWNEPDYGFWKPAPDPGQYVKLMKITYEELKKADPENRVMLGGIIGNDFLRDVYTHGGKGYFDLVSSHPYGWGGDRNRQFDRKLEERRAILAANGDGDKEIWFTECGGTTMRNEFFEQQPQAVANALKLAGEKINRPLKFDRTLKIGVPVMSELEASDFTSYRFWLPGCEFVPVTLERLKTLSPDEIPIVVGAEREYVHRLLIEPLTGYIKRGGIMVALSTIPFYTEKYINEHGSEAMKDNAKALHKQLRMGFHSWWMKQGVPRETFQVAPAEGMAQYGFASSGGHASRFLNNEYMRNGTYTPLLQGVKDGQVAGDVLSLYTFKDWKGAIVATTLIKMPYLYSEQQHADLIQTFMVYALSKKVPRVYFYVFRDTGIQPGEPEDNYGFVTRNLRPKKAYHAYAAMTGALGESPEFIRQLPAPEKFFMMVFERGEDKKQVLAFWSAEAGKEYSVEGVGTFKDGSVHFVDYDGKSNYRITLTP